MQYLSYGRGEGVLEEILGRSFGGIITSDFFGAYRKFQRMSGAVIHSAGRI
jgi:hypothetical protein